DDDVLVADLDASAAAVAADGAAADDRPADAAAVDDVVRAAILLDEKVFARDVMERRERILEEVDVVDLADNPLPPVDVDVQPRGSRPAGIAPHSKRQAIDRDKLAVDGTPRVVAHGDQPWWHSAAL